MRIILILLIDIFNHEYSKEIRNNSTILIRVTVYTFM